MGAIVKYLLDTHAVDWGFHDEARLSAQARVILKNAAPGDLAISDVTLSELARHLAHGVIKMTLPPEVWLRLAIADLQVLPVTPAIALRAAFLDWNTGGKPHRDPADRHIVATAIEHRLPLLTCDRKIHQLTGLPGLHPIW
jgi:PIN domain nuclease of toxin-antitoxin system